MDLERTTVEVLKTGACPEEEGYACLVCGAAFQNGEVYEMDGRYFEAKRAAEKHCADAHGDRLAQLLDGDEKYMSLTDHQKKLLRLMGEGRSDAAIAEETQVTQATVRRQRFAFREKAKQAKMYLAAYELALGGRKAGRETLVPVHSGVRQLDDRFVMTNEESDRYIKNAFESLEPLKLRALPAKEKKKVAVLNLIASRFRRGVEYGEKDVNAILEEIHPDYVTLRRYLIEYGYMGRTASGSKYWVM